jgi:hypothetical protein
MRLTGAVESRNRFVAQGHPSPRRERKTRNISRFSECHQFLASRAKPDLLAPT